MLGNKKARKSINLVILSWAIGWLYIIPENTGKPVSTRQMLDRYC